MKLRSRDPKGPAHSRASGAGKRLDGERSLPMRKPIAAAGWPKVLFFILQFTWGLPVNLGGCFCFSAAGGAAGRSSTTAW